MRKLQLIALVAAALMIAAPGAHAVQNHVGSWFACAIHGAVADPDYMLRLDGFFSGASDPVTFANANFNPASVIFTANAGGTATMTGLVEVVEVNGAAPAGTEISQWHLNVNFDYIDPASVEYGNIDGGGVASLDYYNINPAGIEMVRVGDPTDIVHLWTYPSPGSAVVKPFRVGVGGIYGKPAYAGTMGFSGWLSYERTVNGGVVGGGGGAGSYNNASDFLGELKPVPEPGTMLLVGLGLAGGGARFLRRRKKEQA